MAPFHWLTAVVVAVAWLSLIARCCDIGAPLAVCQGKGPCHVYNSQGLWEDRSKCIAASVVYPRTEEEVLEAVAGAARKKQKIRVISPLAHSRPPLMCPGDGRGGGLLISTRDLASYVSVHAKSRTVTVDAGVNMRQLQDAVRAAGFSFPTSTSWEGVSAAGAISTGAHGSGIYGRGSAIHEYVTGVRMVVPVSSEGHARVVHLTDRDRDLQAAKLSLGLLGVITRLTFKIEPIFKRAVTLSLEPDHDLDRRLVEFLKSSEFATVYWYSSQGQALMQTIDRTDGNRTGDGVNRSSYQSTTVAAVRRSTNRSDVIEREEDSVQQCAGSNRTMHDRVADGGGFLNNAENFTGFPVVGFNDRLVNAGGCEGFNVTVDSQRSCRSNRITDPDQAVCGWDRRADPRLTWDFEWRVPLRRAAAAVRDVMAIRDAGAGNSTRAALCAIEGSGFVMRTLKSSTAYLGPTEDMVTFEMSYYRSKDAFVPKWNGDVLTEIEQLLHEKYGAHLHWGKSMGYYSDGQAANRTVGLDRFLAVRRRFDPGELMINDWTEKLLGLNGKKVEENGRGCALEKLCKCTEHFHCAPDRGYFCRPGRFYKRARVCRK